MKPRILGLVLVALGGACSLSESGLLDAGAIGVDANLPEACSTLDAACLGALGSEWQPVAIGDGGCSSGFSSVTLVTNPRLLDGGCACGGCSVVGAFTCTKPTPISGGNNCGDNPIAQAPPGQCTQASAQHLEAHVVQATGSVGCFAPNDAGSGAAADEVTVCIPGCAADFCSGPSRCVMAEGSVGCPSGFQPFARVGTGVDPGCAACACDAGPPGDCTGTVTGFDNSSCNDGGALVHTYAVGTCNVFDNNTNFQSVLVSLAPPDASCTVSSAPVAGDASLVGAKTICCQ